MRRFAPLMLLLAMLAGCGQSPTAGLPVPKSPDQVLYAAQATLDGLVKTADLYARLPRCDAPGATAVCSSQPAAAEASRLADQVQAAITVARPVTVAYARITSPTATDTQKVQAALDAVTQAVKSASTFINALPK